MDLERAWTRPGIRYAFISDMLPFSTVRNGTLTLNVKTLRGDFPFGHFGGEHGNRFLGFLSLDLWMDPWMPARV